MSFSRRNFLKAAGSGVVLTAVTGETLMAAPTTALSAAPVPFASEKAAFLVNGKAYAAEYEARTTLWEVISMKLGMTGTNRSCNRASCGACSVLVDGIPLYSCHTLATEAVGPSDQVSVTYHDMGGTMHAASVRVTAKAGAKKP